MNLKELLRSKTITGALIGAAGVLVVIVIFSIGAMVGYRKASFEYRWGENYHRNFGGPKGGFILPGDEGMNPTHGTFGTVISLDATSMVIEGADRREKKIVVTDQTIIHRAFETVQLKDIRTKEMAVVIGEPNGEGQIEAKLIRLFPQPADASSTPLR